MSESKTIYSKLLLAKKEIGTVSKNAKNPHFKNTYADINALIEAVEPILLEHGLLLLQPIRDGKQYTEIHDTESGEKVESYLELNMNLQPQAQGSAITYFRRYTLQSLLSLRADDDDGNDAKIDPALNAKTILNASKSLEELKSNWSKLTKPEQALPEITKLKETLKTKLSEK